MATQRELNDIKRWEGSCRWMYLDSRGFVTVGVGNLLKTPEAAQALPFISRGGATSAPATPGKIAATWQQVKNMMPGRLSGAYMLVPSIELEEQEVDNLLRKRVDTEFLPGLAHLFPGFEAFPEPARGVLLDMAFNLGLAGLRGFVHLRKAVAERDWMAAARNCKVITSRPTRNAWRIEMFLAAASS